MTTPDINSIRTRYETDLANANRTRATALAALSHAGTAQADIIRGTGYSRETVRKLIGQGLRYMTEGPPDRRSDLVDNINEVASPDPCGTPCADGHLYEGSCLLSPMIIGTISPRIENDVTRYVWQCSKGIACEGLFHVGYPAAAAARRAYDKHLRHDHPDAI